MDPADAAAVMAIQTEWLEAERLGQADRILRLCTDDVVMQGPGLSPRVGKQAVRALFPQKPGTVDVTISEVEIFGDKLMAVKTARFRTRQRDGMIVTGRHVWILRPSWRVCAVSWMLDELGSFGA